MIRGLKLKLRRALGIKSETDFFSQAGEDSIVWNTFRYVAGKEDPGFYIDIGAYHPYRHSNTYLLYRAGWNGINIDPSPGMKSLFDRERPRDINIEAGVGEQDSKLNYYIVEEGSTMNSFSEANLRRLGLMESVKRTVEVPVFRLDSLLRKYPKVLRIDYLNIDAEGFELEILRGLDFREHSPKLISIEQNQVLTLADVENSEVRKFLKPKGYSPIAKNVILGDVATVFYIRDESISQ